MTGAAGEQPASGSENNLATGLRVPQEPDDPDFPEQRSRVYHYIVNVERIAACSFLVATLGLIILQVISRYIFNAPLTWTEELARFALLWFTFVSAGFVMARRVHIAVDIVASKLGRTGTVVRGAILPEWVGVNMREDLAARLRVPVFVDNDANLGALAQVTWGPHGGCENLIFVKVATGIGAGLVINGSLFYGHVGITGEIGHATISDQGLICRCGNRGCLETVASTATMIDLLSRAAAEPVTTADIIRQASAGDPATLRVVDDAGMAVGRAMAGIANALNPEVIVVGGSLTGLGDAFLNPIERGLLRHAVPLIGETTTVTMSSLGDRAEALGAAALVLAQADAVL